MKPVKLEKQYTSHESAGNLEKQIFDLKQLLEISKGLNSTLDYDLLLDSILFTCMGQMKVFDAGVFTRKELSESGFSLHRNVKGFDLDSSAGFTIPDSSPLIRHLAENPVCATLPELINNIVTDEGLETLVKLNPDILIPLSSKGKLHGILVLGSKFEGETFSEADKEYLLHIAGFASIALHNAFLFEMASTDMMTRLKTRHYFDQCLAGYLEKWSGPNKKLSLILLDIDHFKRINDTYGHTTGDKVINKVAKIIKESIRRNDVAARYGGEEFAVVLPDADCGEAFRIAERIRKRVEENPLMDEETPFVTISLGISQFSPLKHRHISHLIDKADMALYNSKENGRNQTSREL